MTFPFRTVAFDLDGTLADTSPDLTAALNHALGALGRPPLPAPTVRNLVGQGARALIRKGLAVTGGGGEALVELGLPLFLDFYADHVCVGTRPFPGVERALATLAAEDVGLAVCTNKPGRLTALLLDALGWSDRFAAVVSADTFPVRKPDPLPLREAVVRAGGGPAAYVGDSITDAETARAAGVPFVAFSGGFSDRPVEALGADRIVHRWDELVSALQSLAGTEIVPA